MSFCSPIRDVKKGSSWTCFTLDELKNLTNAYNNTDIGKLDPIEEKVVCFSKDEGSCKRYLWEMLRQRLEKFCGSDETCWIDNVDIMENLKRISPKTYRIVNYFTLKPKATKGKYQWLSTLEIDYVLQQYEDLYSDFEYIGCFPSDYYKLNPQLFPTKVFKSVPKSAIVFNHDESHQKGSHWVAVFFDINEIGKKTIEYFDATGDGPTKNLKEFLTHPYFADWNVIINRKKHQSGNSECGVYSLFYIISRLSGFTSTEINQRRISDKMMNQFRANLFRPFRDPFKLN